MTGWCLAAQGKREDGKGKRASDNDKKEGELLGKLGKINIFHIRILHDTIFPFSLGTDNKRRADIKRTYYDLIL